MPGKSSNFVIRKKLQFQFLNITKSSRKFEFDIKSIIVNEKSQTLTFF